MKNTLFFLVLFVTACSQQENYYPPQHEDMAPGIYAKYKGRLDTAYMEKNHGKIANELANLKADKEMVLKELNQAVREDDEFCHDVYQYQKIYDEHNFSTNLMNVDIDQFKAAYQICIDRMGLLVFQERQIKKELDHAKRMAAREPLDSTKFDLVLIERLTKIRKEDQEVRIERSAKNISKIKYAELSKTMRLKDSLNLIEVDQIIQEYGYPSRKIVGDLSTVVWLVLHHQGDIKIRDKYQALIKANTSQGLSRTYLGRSENIRLQNTK